MPFRVVVSKQVPVIRRLCSFLIIQKNNLVPTNIRLSGNTTASHGTNITLFCNFVDSNPFVNNVTFFENGFPQPAARVSCNKLIVSRNINFDFYGNS